VVRVVRVRVRVVRVRVVRPGVGEAWMAAKVDGGDWMHRG
jgi:hypothetical protein